MDFFVVTMLVLPGIVRMSYKRSRQEIIENRWISILICVVIVLIVLVSMQSPIWYDAAVQSITEASK